jgi:hypothetical protein
LVVYYLGQALAIEKDQVGKATIAKVIEATNVKPHTYFSILPLVAPGLFRLWMQT